MSTFDSATALGNPQAVGIPANPETGYQKPYGVVGRTAQGKFTSALMGYQDHPTAVTLERPGPPLPDGWQDKYLAVLRRTGGYYLAAHGAGISPDTAERWRRDDPAFGQRVRDVMNLHGDTLQVRLIESGRKRENPVGYIVRLKALRPQQYAERMMSLNVNVDVDAAEMSDVRELLGAMLQDTSTATQAALTPGQRQDAPLATRMDTGDEASTVPAQKRDETAADETREA